MATITITKQYDNEELMDSVFHNLWRSTSPWIEAYHYSSYDENPTVRGRCLNESEAMVDFAVDVTDIARGYHLAMSRPYYHCGETISDDLFGWDTCVADIVLQCAIFGKVIFG